ncbi:MAG TPA: RidA family protein [Tepidisphaeraceae bacterium]|nr:RidA family protein [Tepidisphaeraceae bacterium]
MRMRFLPALILVFGPTVYAADEPVRYLRQGDETVAAIVSERAGVIHTNQIFWADVKHVLTLLDGSIRNAGGDPMRVVKLNVAVTTQEDADAARAAIREHYPPASRPPASFVVGALPMPDRTIGVDAVALATTRPAMRPVVYISGQAEKGESTADAAAKTIAALVKTLEFLGSKPQDAVHATCFLTPMADAEPVAAELERVFGKKTFSASFIEWKSNLPIEIELIAIAPPAKPDAPPIEYLTPPGMNASPLFARVVRINHGDLIYTAGLYADKPGSAEQQVLSIFEQLQRILKDAGGDMRHLAKATYYISDGDASKQLNVLRPKFYDPARPPAASKAMVPGVGMKDRSIEIDMIGVAIDRAE